MTPKLSTEISDALQAAGERPITVVNPADGRTYVLVKQDVHLRAMDALRAREDEAAIRQGIADMDAGRFQPLDEAFESIEESFREQVRE